MGIGNTSFATKKASQTSMKKKRILLSDIIFSSLLLVLLLTSFISYQRISAQTDDGNLLNNSYQVKNKLNLFLNNLLNAETAQRGYLLTGRTTFLEPYYGADLKVAKNIEDIKILLGDNKEQQSDLLALSTLATNRFKVLENVLSRTINNSLPKDSLVTYIENGKAIMVEIRKRIAEMLQIENDILTHRSVQKDQNAFITPLYSLLLSIIAIVIVTIAYFRLRNEMHLRLVAEDKEATAMKLQNDANKFAGELELKVAERTEELKKLNEELKIRNDIYSYAEANALIGSYSWNMQTGEIKYSDNLFRLLGHQPQEFVPNFDTFLSFVYPDDQEQVVKDGKETFDTHRLVKHIYRMITKQQKIIWCRSSGAFIENEHSKLLVGTVQDITKDVLLRETLAAKNLALERNNEELESFTYIASHDLQEPLRKIQSFSKLILGKKETDLSAETQDYFARINSAAARMQNLIKALLSYSNANNAEIKFTPTDLNSIVEEVKNNLAETLEEKKAVIESDSLPLVRAVPIQLLQLFSNIIHNAVKYSKKDVPPHIKITTTLVSEEEMKIDFPAQKGKYWKISIADNGIGFEQQYEHKIFELFQRLHGRTAYEGTGIGLAICKKIIHNHLGFITAHGQPGIGSVFNLYLPCQNKAAVMASISLS